MRILVSGGGTAGHISPILATVDALKSHVKDPEILYVGSAGLESKIAHSAGLEFAPISAGKLRRFHNSSLLQKVTDFSTHSLNTRDLGRVVKGFAQSVRVLRQFQPDVIFLKGGYVALPVGLAAGLLKMPYVIHESDMRPGLTNRILAKRAEAIAVGFPTKLYKTLPKEKLVYTGNPIRQDVLRATHEQGLKHFKLSAELPVILITGGSQGAQAINHAVIDALTDLTHFYQVLHITGEKHIEEVRFAAKRLELEHPERYVARSFLTDDMGLALAAADVVIGRGGANTFAELALLAKPAIIIPHPGLEDQVINAQALARQGAIKVIQQDRLTKHSLLAQVQQILESKEERELLTKTIEGFGVADAADQLAQLILTHARPPKEEAEEQ
jgi:UDP-N-acetylglucosamine--N-acetylmuramyl-(pentapeptide) pyrophosphoryl-undecaprenol N-acetylglucosamine transferase